MRCALRIAARCALVALALIAPAASALAQAGAPGGEWPTYGGDLGNTRYAARDQINADNFGELEVAWRFKTDNLFSESLVAVDLYTGERKWHFQLVHHGIWDHDIPCAPILIDITVDGRPIKAVAQPTKQVFLYAFDRETGEPAWPIEERPVPAGDVPGEWYAPTQPFPTKPPAS